MVDLGLRASVRVPGFAVWLYPPKSRPKSEKTVPVTRICSFFAPGAPFEVWAKPATRIGPAGSRLIQFSTRGGAGGGRVRLRGDLSGEECEPPEGGTRAPKGTRGPNIFGTRSAQKSKFGRLAILKSSPGLAVSPTNARRPDLSIGEEISPIGFKLKKLWSPEVGMQIRNFHKIFKISKIF